MRVRQLLVIMVITMFLVFHGTVFASGAEETTGEDTYEILWYHIGTASGESDKVFEAVNEYVEPRIGARVRRVLIGWGDYQQRMQTSIASGEPFDMLFTASWMNYNPWASNGGLYPLNDLLEDEGAPLVDLLPMEFIEGNKIDGELYGIAANKELAHQWAVVLNQRFVEKYDFEIPEVITLDQLESMFAVIKENEPGIDVISTRQNVSFEPWLEQFFDGYEHIRVRRDDEDFQVVDLWRTPEMRRLLDRMRSWYEEGYFRSDVATIGDNQQTILSGRWFATITSTTPYADLRQSRQWGFDVIHVPFQTPIISTRDVGGSMVAISATSDNPEKVMEFITLMNTDPYLRNLIEFGIEGEHWEFVDEEAGVITQEGMTDYAPSGGWTLGNQFITYTFPETPEDKWDRYREFNESAYTSRILGFQFDPEPVQTEWAAVENVMAEFETPLLTGSVDPDEFLPEFLEKRDAAGYPAILEELQRQLDAWLAENR